jgi:hypothetical protein
MCPTSTLMAVDQRLQTQWTVSLGVVEESDMIRSGLATYTNLENGSIWIKLALALDLLSYRRRVSRCYSCHS